MSVYIMVSNFSYSSLIRKSYSLIRQHTSQEKFEKSTYISEDTDFQASSSEMEGKKILSSSSSTLKRAVVTWIALFILPGCCSCSRHYKIENSFKDPAANPLDFDLSQNLHVKVQETSGKIRYIGESDDDDGRFEIARWMNTSDNENHIETGRLYFPPPPSSSHFMNSFTWRVSESGLYEGRAMLSPWFVANTKQTKRYIIFLYARFQEEKHRSDSITIHVGKGKRKSMFQKISKVQWERIADMSNGFLMLQIDEKQRQIQLGIIWNPWWKDAERSQMQLPEIYAFLDDSKHTSSSEASESLPDGGVHWVMSERGLFRFNASSLPWKEEDAIPDLEWHHPNIHHDAMKYKCPCSELVSLDSIKS